MRGRIGHAHGDEGNVSILTLGWIIVAALALVVMAAATQLHIDRMRLASLADELALAAADEIDADGYYASTGDHVVLDEAAMSSAVDSWLAADPRSWTAGVLPTRVEAAADGTATVTIARRVWPLFDVEALSRFNEGILLTAEGRARAG